MQSRKPSTFIPSIQLYFLINWHSLIRSCAQQLRKNCVCTFFIVASVSIGLNVQRKILFQFAVSMERKTCLKYELFQYSTKLTAQIPSPSAAKNPHFVLLEIFDDPFFQPACVKFRKLGRGFVFKPPKLLKLYIPDKMKLSSLERKSNLGVSICSICSSDRPRYENTKKLSKSLRTRSRNEANFSQAQENFKLIVENPIFRKFKSELA